MSDAESTVKELSDLVAAFEAERDWEKFHSPKNLAMGIAIETGELMEHFQWISEDESRKVVHDDREMTLVREEIADIFCYLLGLARSLDIDLSDAFRDKMKRNACKYPADQYRGRFKL